MSALNVKWNFSYTYTRIRFMTFIKHLMNKFFYMQLRCDGRKWVYFSKKIKFRNMTSLLQTVWYYLDIKLQNVKLLRRQIWLFASPTSNPKLSRNARLIKTHILLWWHLIPLLYVWIENTPSVERIWIYLRI